MDEEQKGWIFSWRNDVLGKWKEFDDSLFKVLIWCLHKQAVTEHFVCGFGLKPGQFLTGRFKGAKEIGWKWKNDKIREKKGSLFYRKLNKLKELGIIDTRKVFVPDTQGYHDITLVTVYNHSHYLNPNKEEKHTNSTHAILRKTSEPINGLTNTNVLVGNPVIKRKPKSKPREETKPLLTYYTNKYKEIFSEPYHISWAKDSACIKRLLEGNFTATTLFKLIDMFLNDKDEFLTKTGHTIPMFASRINRYVEQLSTEQKIPSAPFDSRHISTKSKAEEKKDRHEHILKQFEMKFKGKENIPDDWWKLIFPNDATNPHRKH